jgi:hypothetical protein
METYAIAFDSAGEAFVDASWTLCSMTAVFESQTILFRTFIKDRNLVHPAPLCQINAA